MMRVCPQCQVKTRDVSARDDACRACGHPFNAPVVVRERVTSRRALYDGGTVGPFWLGRAHGRAGAGYQPLATYSAHYALDYARGWSAGNQECVRIDADRDEDDREWDAARAALLALYRACEGLREGGVK